MKNLKLILVLLCTAALFFTGCTPTQEATTEDTAADTPTVIKVGATPVPHAELLELVKDDLAAQNITLEIVEFTDYVKPNLALNDGELDANFFQHLPYLESFSKDHHLDLASVATIHVEPLGVYSDTIESLDDLEEGSTIAIPSDAVNGGRALILLQSNGLIKLKEGYTLEATELDIVENPKNLVFKAIESAQLPRILPDVDAAVINGNFALEAGFVPTEDAVVLEGSDSPYANILVTRTDNKDNPEIQALVKALQSDKIKDFILETYGGGVVPAF
ncbi:MAG: MetQ/NlpA family ABC transporter substrate-binding protein [Clostridia bacterium]|nr:MetQ/NlpA family ABC transporter substrate-binding protein [Clostridia bacterium]